MSAAQITTENVSENSTAALQGDAQAFAGIEPPAGASLSIADAVAMVKSLHAEWKTARAPYLEALRAAMKASETNGSRSLNDEQARKAEAAVPVPEIIQRPNPSIIDKVVIHYLDGSPPLISADREPMAVMHSTADLEAHYADDADQLRKALCARDAYHRARHEARFAPTSAEEIEAEAARDRHWPATKRASARLNKALALLAGLEATTTTEAEEQARALIQFSDSGAKIGRTNKVSNFWDFGTAEGARIFQVLLNGLKLPSAPAPATPDTAEWDAALAAVEAMSATSETDEEVDATADAEWALLQVRPPHAAAIREKVRRLAMTMPGCLGVNDVFDADRALTWLHGNADWYQRCVGAVYLDLLAMEGAAVPPPPRHVDCPVAMYAGLIEATMAAELSADEAGTTARNAGDLEEAARQDETHKFFQDRRGEFVETITGKKAASVAGASLQLALALHEAELVRGCIDQADRDAAHDRLESLMKSALAVLGDNISPRLWEFYIGGEHPGAPLLVSREINRTLVDAIMADELARPLQPLTPDGVALLQIDRELVPLLAEIRAAQDRGEDPDEAHDRLEALEKRITGLRADTLETLVPKARLAAHWRRFDVTYREMDSLLMDTALMCGLPAAEIVRWPQHIFDEFEYLGGKITALSDPWAGDNWLGVKPPPPSTRALEIQAMITPEVATELRPIALAAHGVQAWMGDDETIKIRTKNEVAQ